MSPADVILERTLPNSVESERAVLGAILLDQTALYPALEVMSQDNLYLEAHRHIFAATPDNEGKARLIKGKQRSGPVGQTIELQFKKNFTKFVQQTLIDHVEAETAEPWYQK